MISRATFLPRGCKFPICSCLLQESNLPHFTEHFTPMTMPSWLLCSCTEGHHSSSNSQPPCYKGKEDIRCFPPHFVFFSVTFSCLFFSVTCCFIQISFFFPFSIPPTLLFRFISHFILFFFFKLLIRLKCFYDSVSLRSEHFSICSCIFWYY